MVMKKRVDWSLHAREEHTLRTVRYDITEDEVEREVEKQVVKIYEGYDEDYRAEKFKTIFQLRGVYITVIKTEGPKNILIITIWESSEKEVKIWKAKKK